MQDKNNQLIKEIISKNVTAIKNNQQLSKKELARTLDATVLLNDIENTKLLVEQGIDLRNEKDLLLLAIIQKRYEIIEILLANDINTYFIIKEIPISLFRFVNVAKDKQLSKITIKYIGKKEFIKSILLEDNSDTIEFLLNNGLNPNEKIKDLSLLTFARVYDRGDIVKILLENGADVSIDKNLLATAINFNQPDIAKLLIEHGADVNQEIEGLSLLAYTIMFGETDIAKLLIEHGADVNQEIKGHNLLVFSILFDKNDTAKLLIKYGAKVNTENAASPLMVSIMFGTHEMSKYLIEQGAKKLSEIDFLGALFLSGDERSLKLLKRRDINIQDVDEDNDSLLMIFLDLDIANFEKNMQNALLEMFNSMPDLYQAVYNANKKIESNLEAFKKTLKNLPDKNSILSDVLLKQQQLSMKLSNISNIMNMKSSNLSQQLQEKFKNVDPIILTQRFIDLGGDINIKNNKNQTALSIAYEKNLIDVVKLLIENGADVNIQLNNGDSLYDRVKYLQQTELIELIEKSSTFLQPNNNPQALMKLLTFFTLDTPIKCTTHSWEGSCENKDVLRFDDFISKVQNQWNTIKDELKELSPNLYQKIESFIFKNTDEATIWSKDEKLRLGWSSVDELKEHINNGKKPFEFVLKEPIKVTNQTITTFGELVSLFKEEIEVRNDSNMLEKIFDDFEIKLNDNDIACDIDASVKGVDFYTDVEKFKSALDIIFQQFIKFHTTNSSLDEVLVAVHKPKESLAKYIELYITHLNSSSNRTPQELLEQVNDGDFLNIREALQNLCDWSVLDSYKNENNKINYLKSNNAGNIEKLDKAPSGFTHILRFYK
ncbi:ankyrin repeat domain-containing protein [Sulfurimonas hydrogeniphila]|uniref:ankyrin repeat domain-containing protein n=1 Tax=Sulfurimonas hydrogeniphila TaxID=2509341 RepID=UPI00125EBD33|nr:ankyrin repeat domain-containing protein [Sulfurimonas hydrogeniphila]